MSSETHRPHLWAECPVLLCTCQVETLFHEFGHGLQHMLTRQSEGLVSGIRGVEWDAVELPSQFMEHWFSCVPYDTVCLTFCNPLRLEGMLIAVWTVVATMQVLRSKDGDAVCQTLRHR
jgi:hypothetical protein